MVGNKKSVRTKITKSVQVKARPSILTQNFVDMLAPPLLLQSMSEDTIDSLNKIIDNTGNFLDWMNVLHRITIGSYALDEHFVSTPETRDAFNTAWQAITIVKLRTHMTGKLGITEPELKSVTLILAATDEMMRMMRVHEIRRIHKITEEYYEEMGRENEKSFPPEERERLAMVRQLEREKRQVLHLKEAA